LTYKSSFQDRASQASEAKSRALEQYRSRPPIDEKTAAERVAAGLRREAGKAEKAASKTAAKDAAAAAKATEVAAAAPPTEAERKAARDARYAARKRRK